MLLRLKRLFWHLSFWGYWLRSKLAPQTQPMLSLLTDEEQARVAYYCKLSTPVALGEDAVSLSDVPLTRKTGYAYDLYRMLFGFSDSFKFSVLFGDVIHVPPSPTFVKSRPVIEGNENSVLLPLNTFRHLIFVNDHQSFVDKKPMIVWRGAAYRDVRKHFLKAVSNLDFCDIQDTSRHAQGGAKANWLTREEQLKFKFIFSVEGNDVASNLKWIMSSNSLCFMQKPTCETWFMEGALIPDYHYVLIDDDFSNVKAKYDFYLSHPDEALKIIKQAQTYVAPFKDVDRQFALGRHVIQRYASHVLN
jgi:Glycosyl transferase family 90